jgi:hypothetical protein
MQNTIEKIDKLRKLLKEKDQLILLSQIRKGVKQSDKYSGKLCNYFSETLDGMEPEVSARENCLL